MRPVVRSSVIWVPLWILCAVPWTAAQPSAAPSRAATRPPSPDRDAPYQRLLTGADAREVAELEKKRSALEQEGKCTAAADTAARIVRIRTRRQGPQHWQTADARRSEATLRHLAAQPAATQQKMAAVARSLAQAEALQEQRRFVEAEKLYQEALDIRRQVLGEQHADTATACNDLAECLGAQGKYTAAEPLHRQALSIRRQILGEEHPNTAAAYNNLAINLYFQGQTAAAEPFFRQALALFRRVHGEEHPDTIRACNNLAINLVCQNKTGEAEPLLRQALELFRKVQGEEHADTATAYDNLAHNLQIQNRYAEAEPYSRKALALCRKVLGEEHPNTARAYNNVAQNLCNQGRFGEAAPLFRKALAIWRKTLGEENPATTTGYHNLANSLETQGRYGEAEPIRRMILATQRKLLGEHHPDLAGQCNNLAGNLSEQHRYAEAVPFFRKALELWRQGHGADHFMTGLGYNNLACSLGAQGKYAQAEPLLRQALAIYSKALGEGHANTAHAYCNLAQNLDNQGRHAEAEPLHRKGLAVVRNIYGAEHHETATAYGRLGCNLYAQGHYRQAEEMLRKAAASYQSQRVRMASSGLDRAGFSALYSPLLPLAALLARQGKAVAAFEQLEADLARGLLDDLWGRQTLRFTAPQTHHREALLGQLRVLNGQIAALASANTLSSDEGRRRCNELGQRRDALQAELDQFELDMAHQYHLGTAKVSALADIQKHLGADTALLVWVDIDAQPNAVHPDGDHWACVVRHEGAPSWVQLPGSGPQGKWTERDSQLPQQLRALLSTRPATATASWREVAEQLAAQRLAPLQAALGPRGRLPAVDHLIVLTSRSMAGIPIEALSDRYRVSYAPSSTVFAWLHQQRRPAGACRLLALGDPTFRRTSELAAAPPPPNQGELITLVAQGANAARAGLRSEDILLEYAGKPLAGPGALAATLRDAAARRIESDRTRSGQADVPVKVWRAGQTLTMRVAPGPLGLHLSAQPAAAALLALREGDRILRVSRGKDYLPLPGSRAEVEAIAALFDESVKLLGHDASEQRLDELAASDKLARFRFLHFATHAELNAQAALDSALILSNDRLPDAVQQALAGQQVYEGRLTAHRILHSWKLNAELVTLSACETGLGRYEGGEGYLGFAQALFLAGSRSVLVSLWQVDDRATALLMVRFYQNLLGKRPGLAGPLSRARALAEAKEWLRQRSAQEIDALVKGLPAAARSQPDDAELPPAHPVLHSFQHPYYWAGFILIGDPG